MPNKLDLYMDIVMHTFKLLLLVVFTFTSLAVFSVQTETALKGADTINVGAQAKFVINSKTPELGILKDKMASLNIPAVSIAFMENNEISWTLTEGVIDFTSQREIDKNTVFQTASVPESEFSPVPLQSRQEYSEDPNSAVNTLLKSGQLPAYEWSKSSPNTLRRLLSHSSGTKAHGFRTDASTLGVPSFVHALYDAGSAGSKGLWSDIEPSSTPRYSGGGATFAQLVLQGQSRIPLPQLANTSALHPLKTGVRTDSQPRSKKLASNAAIPHRSNGLPIDGDAYTYANNSTAGLWTTPTELLRLASKIQMSYQDLDKSRITNKTVLESMGIGFFIEKPDGSVTSLSHGGVNEGFRANIFIHAQTGDGIAIMTNSDNGEELINDLLSHVRQVYGWSQFSQIEEEETVLQAKVPEEIKVEDKVITPIRSNVALVAEGEQF